VSQALVVVMRFDAVVVVMAIVLMLMLMLILTCVAQVMSIMKHSLDLGCAKHLPALMAVCGRPTLPSALCWVTSERVFAAACGVLAAAHEYLQRFGRVAPHHPLNNCP
jgi:hypothetical protein